VLVTADTNIWISAFNFSGNPRRLIVMAAEGKIDLAICDDIIRETRRILGTRFHWSPEPIDVAEMDMRAISRHVIPRVRLDVVKDDPDDNRIVECAVSSHSDFLVTGDKDLLRLGAYDAIRMITVADFLETMKGRVQER
jgi:putative PIN family toxin of toxin-antitoxin system